MQATNKKLSNDCKVTKLQPHSDSLTLAERMMHMSHRLTLTALRSSLFRGQPARTEIFGKFWSVFHSLLM